MNINYEKNRPTLTAFDLRNLASPAFIIDQALLVKNLNVLRQIREATGCHILLAQKAFANFRTYPLIGEYLDGTTASGLYETKLGFEEMPGKEVHCFSPAYTETDLSEILTMADHVIFNSWAQWLKHKEQVKTAALARSISVGLRINPEYSEVKTAMYDPCGAKSRFGIRIKEFADGVAKGYFEGIDGLHFHALCEQDSDALLHTWEVVKKNFLPYLKNCRWLNMGGGHHITRSDYDIDTLITVIKDAQSLGLKVYLEPGEAIAFEAGFLKAKVIDVVPTADVPALVIDASAACHMPDVLEMPYTPRIMPLINLNAKLEPAVYVPSELLSEGEYMNEDELLSKGKLSSKGEISSQGEISSEGSFELNAKGQNLRRQAANLNFGYLATICDQDQIASNSKTENPAPGYRYQLTGPTCLAGDIIGEYIFPCPILPGDQIIFCDMAIYSMVKTTTFNGIALPDIYYAKCDNNGAFTELELLRGFNYADFKNRL